MTDDHKFSLLQAEVQNLSHAVGQLLERVPNPKREWLKPTELARMLGVTPKTIANWRKDGKFKPDSFRPQGRSFEYHRTHAVADVQPKPRDWST